jgi:AcrR family transcriptional regulator
VLAAGVLGSANPRAIWGYGTFGSVRSAAISAGVAIGTIFRHFPTKQALLQAIMKGLLLRLTQEATALAVDGDPGTALFIFFTHVVEQAAHKRTVVDLLAETGIDLQVTDSVQALRQKIEELLNQSQQAGAVRQEIRLDEVIALLASTCQGALHAGWDHDLQQRTLAIIFNGLRAPAHR